MVALVLIFLAASLILYTLMGGADFGAGIVELVTPRKLKGQVEKSVYQALAPVWEANHMWVILAVVILFNGFPGFYSELSILLHFPLTLMLIGIILRGCAFTFRHYDAKKDQTSLIYSWTFRLSSVLVSFFIGVITGSLVRGGFERYDRGATYWDIYWTPWLNPFCIVMGLFFVCLFAYQASVFFVGEDVEETLKVFFVKLARIFNGLSILSGMMVFILGWFKNLPFTEDFLGSPISLSCLFIATVLVYPIHRGLNQRVKWRSRILVGIQISAIVLGWASLSFPNFIRYTDGSSLSLLDSAAPSSTLYYLSWALVVGMILILPSLLYLMSVFKKGKTPSISQTLD